MLYKLLNVTGYSKRRLLTLTTVPAPRLPTKMLISIGYYFISLELN